MKNKKLTFSAFLIAVFFVGMTNAQARTITFESDNGDFTPTPASVCTDHAFGNLTQIGQDGASTCAVFANFVVKRGESNIVSVTPVLRRQTPCDIALSVSKASKLQRQRLTQSFIQDPNNPQRYIYSRLVLEKADATEIAAVNNDPGFWSSPSGSPNAGSAPVQTLTNVAVTPGIYNVMITFDPGAAGGTNCTVIDTELDIQ